MSQTWMHNYTRIYQDSAAGTDTGPSIWPYSAATDTEIESIRVMGPPKRKDPKPRDKWLEKQIKRRGWK